MKSTDKKKKEVAFSDNMKYLCVLFTMAPFLLGIEILAQPSLELRNIHFIDTRTTVELLLVIHTDKQEIAIRADYWVVNVDSGAPNHSLLCMDVPAIQLAISGGLGPVGSVTCGVPVLKSSARSLFYAIPPSLTFNLLIEIPFDSVFYAAVRDGQQFWVNIPYWNASDMSSYSLSGKENQTISGSSVAVETYEIGDSREVILVHRDTNPNVKQYNQTLPDSKIVGSMHALGYP